MALNSLTDHLCQKTDIPGRQQQSVLYIDGLLLHFDMDLFGHTLHQLSAQLHCCDLISLFMSFLIINLSGWKDTSYQFPEHPNLLTALVLVAHWNWMWAMMEDGGYFLLL